MIQANELRIGNWVQNHLTGGYVRIGWLAIKHLVEGLQIPIYEPISLTPEILGKLPLKGGGPDGTYGEAVYLPLEPDDGINGDCLCFPKLRKEKLNYEVPDVLIYEMDTPNDSHAIPTPAKYLHQLQNLWFALKNEELEINL